MNSYIFVFLTSLLVTLVAAPRVKEFSIRAGIMDLPGNNKIHARPIPKAGGLAISIGVLAALVSFASLGIGFANYEYVILCSFLILFLGLIDDMRGTTPATKFIVQFAVSIILVMLGWKVGYLPVYISLPLTVFWLVGVTNAVNLLDGMDGIAAGTSFMAGLLFFVVGFMRSDIILSVFSLVLAGSCLGFLRYNFHPAKMFMGDTGSLFVGFLLAFLGVQATLHAESFSELLVPVFILGAPIFDTLISIARRSLRKKAIFQSDRGHTYDFLMGIGVLSYRKVVLCFYIFTFLMGVGALCLL